MKKMSNYYKINLIIQCLIQSMKLKLIILKLKQLFVNINFVHVIIYYYLLLFYLFLYFILNLLNKLLIDTEQPLNVNFLRYKPGTILKIPILFVNEDDNIDIKRGGYLHIING